MPSSEKDLGPRPLQRERFGAETSRRGTLERSPRRKRLPRVRQRLCPRPPAPVPVPAPRCRPCHCPLPAPVPSTAASALARRLARASALGLMAPREHGASTTALVPVPQKATTPAPAPMPVLGACAAPRARPRSRAPRRTAATKPAAPPPLDRGDDSRDDDSSDARPVPAPVPSTPSATPQGFPEVALELGNPAPRIRIPLTSLTLRARSPTGSDARAMRDGCMSDAMRLEGNRSIEACSRNVSVCSVSSSEDETERRHRRMNITGLGAATSAPQDGLFLVARPDGQRAQAEARWRGGRKYGAEPFVCVWCGFIGCQARFTVAFLLRLLRGTMLQP